MESKISAFLRERGYFVAQGMQAAGTYNVWAQRVGLVLGGGVLGMGMATSTVFALTSSDAQVGFKGMSEPCETVFGLHKNGSLRLNHRIVEGCVSTNGSLRAETVQIQGDVKTNGSFTAENVQIQGVVKTNGSFVATHVTAEGTVDVNGRADLQSTHVKGELSVSGTLAAQKSHFDEKITLSCRNAGFEHCQIDRSIVVKKAWSFKNDFGGIHNEHGCVIGSQVVIINGQRWVVAGEETESPQPLLQVIDLSGDTCVTGNITFEGGNGEVHLSNGAQVKGQVIGGKIVQKD
jgi:cytoskeletal protein CcmA (bactofilin family)